MAQTAPNVSDRQKGATVAVSPYEGTGQLDLGHDFDVRRSTYEWSVRLFKALQKILKVNVKLHQTDDQIRQGEIFLFNHFARFETFIPQYLIYVETGAMSRSVAASEFFVKGDPFSNYLLNAGAVPHTLPNLLPFLAAEVLRGRKVIVFPEGGMVKDRRVLDKHGKYSVYSRVSRERRKHHTGPAVLGLALDLFKRAVLEHYRRGNNDLLQQWTEQLRLDNVEQLLAAARRPTTIVPANITFYPIRVSDNLLRKGAELLSRGLSRRMTEELMIEGNILLKHTDMDVRLGEPILPGQFCRWFDKSLLSRFTSSIRALEQAFIQHTSTEGLGFRFIAHRMSRSVLRVRDEYMHRMYSNVTVNLSHLASRIVLNLVERGRTEINQREFHRMLYLSVKQLQDSDTVHLHRSLCNPETYAGLLDEDCAGLSQFVNMASSLQLLESADGVYRFLPKLREEFTFDEIRLENLVAVYANEVAPLTRVSKTITTAARHSKTLSSAQIARLRFDDECLSLAWDRRQYSKPRYTAINDLEIARADPSPFLLESKSGRGVGVVLVHGFLGSPAAVRGFGDRLASLGHSVLGVRLKGHGTSPWDLRDRAWEDWLGSVQRGFRIMSALAEQIVVVGFSTGGALALRLAADLPERLAGVAAVAVPLKFQNKNMIFVPLVHAANRLLRWISTYEGIMPFRLNDNSEQPDINYRHMPIRGLYELHRMVDDLENHLDAVCCPVLLLQGDTDPVVVPKSAEIILDKLTNTNRSLKIIPSQQHAILTEDTGGTQQVILDFIDTIPC